MSLYLPVPATVTTKDRIVTRDWQLFFQKLIDSATVAGSTFTLLTADPASPTNDTWWVVRSGSSPTTVSVKARIGGVTYTVASMEF